MRAEAEDVYGMRLGEIGPATDKIQGGFSRDDGASVRKVENLHIKKLKEILIIVGI